MNPFKNSKTRNIKDASSGFREYVHYDYVLVYYHSRFDVDCPENHLHMAFDTVESASSWILCHSSEFIIQCVVHLKQSEVIFYD